MRASKDPGSVVSTYALGSCLGITLYDPAKKVGGMLHAMLPSSKINNSTGRREAMFLDTGMPILFKMLNHFGADIRQLECKVFGGAQVLQADRFFKIGAKNIDTFDAMVREMGLNLKAREVGGQVNRTIKLHLQTGQVWVKTPNKVEFWK